jgi:Tfp pilus assembly protein PilF
MSKAMLVTMPFVLLLLDYWPLGRFKPGGLWRLVREKTPFLVLALAASVMTFVVQKQGGAMKMIEYLPLGARIENALISYCRYVGKTFWPSDLAFFYPHPGYWPLDTVLLAGVFLFGITLVLIVKRGRYPYMLMGWLWYVGTLVPVIGLVQVGEQSMADRYTYVPSLGLFIIAIWGVYELTRRWRYQAITLAMTGSAGIVLCLGLTRQQIGYWKDSETLYRHALDVIQNNYLPHKTLGDALMDKGQINGAIRQYQEAIQLKPDDCLSHNNLGNALLHQGQTAGAISQFQEAIRLNPDYAPAYYNLGVAFINQGQIDEAIGQFQEAIRRQPDNAEAHSDLGVAFINQGQIDEAISQFQEATRLNPDNASLKANLTNALEAKSKSNVRTSGPVKP